MEALKMAFKESFVLAPIGYAVFLLIVTNNFAFLGTSIMLSFIIGATATAALAGLGIFGVGENAGGTIILFILIMGAGFYGIATNTDALGGVTSWADHVATAIENFFRGIWNWITGATPPPGSPPNPPPPYVVTTAQHSIDYPYKSYVDVLLGVMYALGLFFLISDRGGD